MGYIVGLLVVVCLNLGIIIGILISIHRAIHTKNESTSTAPSTIRVAAYNPDNITSWDDLSIRNPDKYL